MQSAAALAEKSAVTDWESRKAPLRAAAATVQAGALLWGGLLRTIKSKFESGQWSPVMCFQKHRYDESAFKLRVGETDKSNPETVQLAKIMQTELTLGLLVHEPLTNRFLHVSGFCPQHLQLVNRATARTTRRTLLNSLQRVPEWDDVSQSFDRKVFMSVADRYAANHLAERAILCKDMSWTRAAFACDVHRAATVNAKTLDLQSDDVSGILNTSLSQGDAGAVTALRCILTEILRERLSICYDAPPTGRCDEFREHLFELCLPAQQPNSGDFVSQPGHSFHRVQRQRLVLRRTLNGDLESAHIVHFCCYGCCSSPDETWERMVKHAVPALLPGKMPRFARSRWTHQMPALSWATLIAGHHNLLQPLIERFTGKPISDPVAAAAAETEGLEALMLEWAPAFDADAEAPEIALPDLVEEGAGDAGDDPQRADGQAGLSWAEKNKNMKAKSRKWAESNPFPRLVVLLHVMALTGRVMHGFLNKSGRMWELRQQWLGAAGQPRTYRVVEAALAKDIDEFMSKLHVCFRGCPALLPLVSRTLAFTSLLFRTLSRAACATHALLRNVRRQHPFKLFRHLVEDRSKQLYEEPACARDSLAEQFVQWFASEDALRSDTAKATLQSLALEIECDIAGIDFWLDLMIGLIGVMGAR